MKSLVGLLSCILVEAGIRSGVRTSRDVQTLRRRVKHEGDSFMTITLPEFAKSFERALCEGRVAPGMFKSFRLEHSGIPSFLKGFLCHVFDSDGCLRDNASVDCISAVRQICLFAKKMLVPCDEAREQAAIEAYVSCDESVVDALQGQIGRYFQIVANIIGESLEETLSEATKFSETTGHGSGATQERASQNGKWRFSRWHRRLASAGFPYWPFGRGSVSELTAEDMRCWPETLEPEMEPPVRVVFVPKTQKAPRVIAVEPVVMQFAQQVLATALRDSLEKSPYTRGHVNFRDQGVNQRMAFIGSIEGHLATIDMKEASDRVSVAHVQAAFSSNQEFLKLLLAARSMRAELPNGEVYTLRKFASMGSATCFPVEAYIFYIGILASRILTWGQFPTPHFVRLAARDVAVYGDDLIVPADEAPSICVHLESLGFKVNSHKSFWTGKFRESCGKDWFAGQEVTPVYLRRPLPSDRKDVSGLLSTVATANQLFERGYQKSADYLRKVVESTWGPLPQVAETSPAIGWHMYSEHVPPRRWNPLLQRTEIRVLVPVTPSHADPLDGDAALAKCFRHVGRSVYDPYDPSQDGIHMVNLFVRRGEEHLERSSTRYAVTLQRSWVPLR